MFSAQAGLGVTGAGAGADQVINLDSQASMMGAQTAADHCSSFLGLWEIWLHLHRWVCVPCRDGWCRWKYLR